ncbi:Conserved_hypothetical protein [Hexamita inflata]|uniref:Lipid-binding serum glycoprotein N-terminal domain-containing protein n=1 Tax=Hexamita inflata TaxID=28002 RepID=A0AA86Q818_9EUKA|nr:Conserved hypothetical protein [Hexamita inflata]
MLLLSLLFQRECEMGFSRILGSQDTAQITTATKRGASNFMLCGIKNGMGYITNINIPDMTFSFNAGISTVDLALSDIKIAEVQVPNIEFDLNNPIQSQMSLLNCSLIIKFQWKLQQQSYPYITDQGSGRFNVVNGEMKAIVNSTANIDDCPGHMILNFIRAEVDYESLQIILDGGDSWLFQSIINLVLSEIEDVVVGSLCNILLKAFIGLINDVFEDGHRLNEYPEHNQVLKDERYTSGIYTSSEGFVTLRFSGYVYHRNSLQDEFMTSNKLSNFTYNKFNSDMQVVIHEAAVNNAFYIFHKYENVYSGLTFQVLETPYITIGNVAGIFHLKVLANNSEVNLDLLAQLVHEDDRQTSRCQVYFKFDKYQSFSEDQSLNLEILEQQVIEHLNKVIKFASYQLNYSPNVDMNSYVHLYDAVEHVIRLVGPEQYVCPW